MRYPLLDEIRGLTLVSMLLYHGCWDLIYIFDVKAPWYESLGAYYWQQSICITFIFLSGFCWHFGRKKLRRGLKIFSGGMLITVVTLLFMPEDKVVFGILTFLGSAALLVILLNNVLKLCDASLGFGVSMLLFFLTKQVNGGMLGIGPLRIAEVPPFFYKNLFTAFWGFPHTGFFSTDYFSVFPWIFLYTAGYYSYIWIGREGYVRLLKKSICPPLGMLGRYSFWIYMVHQPVLYLILSLVFARF